MISVNLESTTPACVKILRRQETEGLPDYTGKLYQYFLVASSLHAGILEI
jgi:hypothetical protein